MQNMMYDGKKIGGFTRNQKKMPNGWIDLGIQRLKKMIASPARVTQNLRASLKMAILMQKSSWPAGSQEKLMKRA
jgi:hypothetical protein